MPMKRLLMTLAAFMMVASTMWTTAQNIGFPKNDANPLVGIWQMCFYVSETPNSKGDLRSGHSFKILTNEGQMINLVNRPPHESIILGFGTWEVVSDSAFVEHITKTLDNPVLNNSDNLIEYSLSEDGNLLSLKFYIEKDEKGNVIDCWFHETWRRVVMPEDCPPDLIR